MKGVNYFLRQIALLTTPVIKLVNDKHTWTMSVSGTPRATPDVTFKDREEFTEDCNFFLLRYIASYFKRNYVIFLLSFQWKTKVNCNYRKPTKANASIDNG
jgi:hypothetical protein